MIYLALFALIVTAGGFYFRVRSGGLASALLDSIAAVITGWISGLLVGAGARIGMWSIPFFNGVDSRFTFDGTFQVILTFSLFGIGLGLVYEFVFRSLLRKRGILFGVLVTLVAAYPLASAGLQQISFTPPVVPTIAFSLLFVGLMFVPFAMALELLLRRYHRIRDCRHLAPSQISL
jgi:hypothetical protein